jgi:hypothetical protein
LLFAREPAISIPAKQESMELVAVAVASAYQKEFRARWSFFLLENTSLPK